ncbi:neuropeptides capa receptor-like isoform X1 [Choristoneura fumiferana]|uniref:neuropeptides capa receptor-like isoform X1 n=1 Tax=Choristoneura fumiferana TaxID=7141 RepID=UPI003D15D59D
MNNSVVSSEFSLEKWSVLLSDALQVEAEYAKIMMATFICIMFVLSLFGNGLTCYVIYNDKSMHTATNYYLFNLAVSDSILTFAIMSELVDETSASVYPYSEWVCQVQWFSVACLWNNTMLTMTALAVERYIAIWHPLKLKSTPVWRRMIKIIILLWLMAIAESVPEMLSVTLIKSRQTTVCFVVPTPLARIVNGVLAIVTFVIPLLIMTFVYARIVIKVNTRQIKLKLNVSSQKNNSGKVNKLMVAMTLSFVICWMPYFIERMLIAVLDPHKLLNLAEFWGFLVKLVIINGWISVVLNPILFSLVSTKFRRALKTLWYVKIRRTME